MESVLTSVAIVLSLAVLVSAAASDWFRREASDVHWVILMAVGMVLFCMCIVDAELPPSAYLMPVSMALMCADLVWERDPSAGYDIPIYVAIVVTSAIPCASLWDEPLVRTYLSIPAIYVLMNTLYYTGIVRGGADAKSVIAIAFVFPSYPSAGPVPFIPVPDGTLSQVIVPAFSVFFVASLLTVLLCIPYAVVNLVRGDVRMPYMLAGVRMDVRRIEGSHVWPMEDIEDGRPVMCMSGIDDPDAVRRLEECGRDRVWVTPIIPFLIPIAVSTALILIAGNPLFLLT